jgi:hypothetical protein
MCDRMIVYAFVIFGHVGLRGMVPSLDDIEVRVRQSLVLFSLVPVPVSGCLTSLDTATLSGRVCHSTGPVYDRVWLFAVGTRDVMCCWDLVCLACL